MQQEPIAETMQQLVLVSTGRQPCDDWIAESGRRCLSVITDAGEREDRLAVTVVSRRMNAIQSDDGRENAPYLL